MKRRSFLGFMGGAVASGPTLAKGLAEQATAGMPGVLSQAPSFGGSVAMASDNSWVSAELAQVRDFLAGKDPERELRDKQRNLYALEARDRYRIDSLRSVSPSSRHAMFTKGEFARQDRARIIEAETRRSWLERRLLGQD